MQVVSGFMVSNYFDMCHNYSQAFRHIVCGLISSHWPPKTAIVKQASILCNYDADGFCHTLSFKAMSRRRAEMSLFSKECERV